MHEVVHLRVDPINDGHQIVKNVFSVVHSRIHEVPEKEDKTERILECTIDHCLKGVVGGRQGGRREKIFFILTCRQEERK